MKRLFNCLFFLACCQFFTDSLAKGCSSLAKNEIDNKLSVARKQLNNALDDCPSLENAINLALVYHKIGNDAIAYEVMQDARNDLLENDADKIKWLQANITLALAMKNTCQANTGLNELLAVVGETSAYKKFRMQLFQFSKDKVLNSNTIACSLTASRSVTMRSMKIRAKIDLAIHFDFNRAQLTATGQKQTEQLSIALTQGHLQDKAIKLIGHTDQIGMPEYNLNLSLRRAKAVAAYLMQLHPKLSSRISTDGLGETQLLSYGTTEQDNQLNRRVEVQIE